MHGKHDNIEPSSEQPEWKRNEQAFNHLFRQNFRILSSFAYSIIHQNIDAQDIVQDCFIKVWNRCHQLKDLANLKPYLYTAVKNDCINYLRQQNVHDKKRQRYLDQIATTSTDAVDLNIVRAETKRELDKRIEQLPQKMREVIRLYYYECKSSGEIGRLLEKNPDTVQHQRIRALRLLRKKKYF